MRQEETRLLQEMRDSIAAYVEDRQNGWRSDSFDATRYLRDMDRLSMMIDLGSPAVVETCITLEDVRNAYDEMRAAHEAFKAIEEPETHARYRASSLLDWTRRAARIHGEESAEYAQAMHEFEEARDAYKAMRAQHTPEEYAQAAQRDKIASRVWANVRRLHVEQCAQVARLALTDNDSWTSQPTRYKRMRRKVEEITDAYLCGTGCRVSVSESGKVTINHSWDCFFTHVEYSDDVTISTFPDEYEAPNIGAMRDDISSPRHEQVDNATVSDVRALCESYTRTVNSLRDMNSAYQQATRDVMAPYGALGFDVEEMRRACRVYA